MNNEYPIVGMSPGNSYFKEDKIKFLLRTCVEKYGRVAMITPDIPAISTYIALGYPESRARKDKAIPQGNLLKHRTERAIAELGYNKNQVLIIDWETEIEPNKEYKKLYKEVRDLYDSNKVFRADVNETTKGVILGSKKEIADLNEAIKIGSHYLISELAFLDVSAKFLDTQKTTFVYHNNWPVYENYIAGKYDGKPKDHMGFLLLRPEE